MRDERQPFVTYVRLCPRKHEDGARYLGFPRRNSGIRTVPHWLVAVMVYPSRE
ncbi:hypothetical protein [Candidatus Methylacidithermus pantelleriae]|uniref:hypothetical protein n=1 Tax=Candidatus Methylacidithermus pantelleriae TaxID=2744239 RepID=UPI00157C1D50|nr:hypothetical protein [Candidatus Methylacidithermus pantelleriae]